MITTYGAVTLLSAQASERLALTANPVRSAGWRVRLSTAARSDAPSCIRRGSEQGRIAPRCAPFDFSHPALRPFGLVRG